MYKMALPTIFALGLSLFVEGTAPAFASEFMAEAESENGRDMVMTFEGDGLTMDSENAVFCYSPTGTLTRVRLWMPEHGHGSGPTKLEATADGCTKITFIDFSMAGVWDLQISFADGDKGVFHVNVAR